MMCWSICKRGLMAALLSGVGLVRAQAQVQDLAPIPPPESFSGWLFTLQRMKEIRPVTDATYRGECGECHLAYPPGLLPARSWELLLTPQALSQHFGVNADIEPTKLQAIRAYAIAYAADRSYYKRARKIAVGSATGPAPQRITELTYVSRTHRQIPADWIAGNPQVKSLSQCDRCHTQAADGVFDNDTVSIPNHPR